jgi:hypothetical protein
MLVAEHGSPTMLARIGPMRALHCSQRVIATSYYD